MTEKEAILGPLKTLGGKAWSAGKGLSRFLLGEKIPGWAYPATALAAASPIIGHELERRTNAKKRRAARRRMLMSGQYPAPPTGPEALRQNPYIAQLMAGAKSANDEHHIDKAAEAIGGHLTEAKPTHLNDLNQMMQDAKARGAKRKSVRSLDAKAERGPLGQRGKGARGVSAGTSFGNGGGYGK